MCGLVTVPDYDLPVLSIPTGMMKNPSGRVGYPIQYWNPELGKSQRRHGLDYARYQVHVWGRELERVHDVFAQSAINLSSHISSESGACYRDPY